MFLPEFPVYFFTLDGFAFIMGALSLAEAEVDLGEAMFREIELDRNERQPFFPYPVIKTHDLLLMHEQLSFPARVIILHVGRLLRIGSNMNIFQKRLNNLQRYKN